jgi:hypothetical protein
VDSVHGRDDEERHAKLLLLLLRHLFCYFLLLSIELCVCGMKMRTLSRAFI